MGKHAQIVIGPAGSGKSTYCKAIQHYCNTVRRSVHVVNLDPAAEAFDYDVAINVQDLISVTDVMEELDYGPNGGLVYCMEYLVENIEWLAEQIDDFGDDYLIFDCPGQVELYMHLPVMKSIVDSLTKWGYSLCIIYCIDSLIISDASRFIAGTLMCLSGMVQLEVPHINLLTKCDMVEDKKLLESFLDPDVQTLCDQLDMGHNNKFSRLNQVLAQLVDEYSMVAFLPFDITDEEGIDITMQQIDNALQYYDDLDTKAEDPQDHEGEFDEDSFNGLVDKERMADMYG